MDGQEVETKRLRLRRWRADDLETLVGWYSDPEIVRHLGQGVIGRAETQRALASTVSHWKKHGFGQWAVEDKTTGRLIGRSGLSYHRVWPADPEVGWLIEVASQGRGYATEAGEASIRHAFEELGFDRVVSICTEANTASRRVMEKLGLRRLTELDDPVTGLRLWIHALDRTSKPS